MNEAELLFSEVLKCGRIDLYRNKRKYLDKNDLRKVSLVLKRRLEGEPLQYILGKCEFMGLDFAVSPGVLIPRPETEILVEAALKALAVMGQGVEEVHILDLCAGSGCIGISLAKFFSGAKITALDLSQEALSVARSNARSLRISKRINFVRSDLFRGLCANARFDMIVSNPPYVKSLEIDTLAREISFEPRLALDGGPDGLDFYRRIIPEAGGRLRKGGLLLLEIGFAQLEEIKKIFQKFPDFAIIEVKRDYQDIERIIIAKKEK